MSDTQLTGCSFGPAAGGPPTGLVALLHGLGADANDLIALAPALARTLPNALFVSLNAPHPCDMAPVGRQWFSVQDRTPAKMLAGAAAARPLLDAFLDEALDVWGLDGARLALIGFSQGAMMALHAGLRRAVPPAAIVAFSGALVGEVPPAPAKGYPPVLLVHGEADDVVPFSAFGHARTELAAAGVPVEALARPALGHGIDDDGLAAAEAFLGRRLGAAAGRK